MISEEEVTQSLQDLLKLNSDQGLVSYITTYARTLILDTNEVFLEYTARGMCQLLKPLNILPLGVNVGDNQIFLQIQYLDNPPQTIYVCDIPERYFTSKGKLDAPRRQISFSYKNKENS